MEALGVSTTDISNETEQKNVDALIDELTAKAITMVGGDKQGYGIMTACVIDGEFVLCSDYAVNNEMADRLEKAANELAKERHTKKTFEGTYLVKEFKNDNGQAYPFTVDDCLDESDAKAKLAKILNKAQEVEEWFSWKIRSITERC